MQVTYMLSGALYTLELETGDDLQEILSGTDRALRSQHPELANAPNLLVTVTDGILNGLADDSNEIFLGELASEGSKP